MSNSKSERAERRRKERGKKRKRESRGEEKRDKKVGGVMRRRSDASLPQQQTKATATLR